MPANPKRSTSKITKCEKGIWQRRFWEHQIRDDLALVHHIQYVHFNPVKHGLVWEALLSTPDAVQKYSVASDISE